MSWAPNDGGVTDATNLIETRSAPAWILAAVVVVDLVAFASRMFLGNGGAGAGYALGLIAFVLILVFRRRYGVLSERYFVDVPSGLSQLVAVCFLMTAAVVFFCAWPIATEISRG